MKNGQRRLVGILLGLVGCLPAPPPTAQPIGNTAVYFWGIRKNCQRDAYLSSSVEKRLYQMGDAGGPLVRLLPRPSLENASAQTIAAAFVRSCSGSNGAAPHGVLLGGRVEERGGSPPLVLMRLFRIDLASQQIAYLDHYCRGCDIARTLATQAAFLLETASPAGAQASANTPTFCAATEPPAASFSAARKPSIRALDKRVILHVHNANPRTAAAPGLLKPIEDALRLQLFLTAQNDPSRNPSENLDVAVFANSSAQLSLRKLGGGNNKAAEKTAIVKCAKCSAEVLADRVTRAAGLLLDAAEDVGIASSSTLSTMLTSTPAIASVQWPPPGVLTWPLMPAMRSSLCDESAKPNCAENGGPRLDSGLDLSPFFDPQCGELVGDAATSLQ